MTNKTLVKIILLLLLTFFVAFLVLVGSFVSNQQNETYDPESDDIPYSENLNGTIFPYKTTTIDITIEGVNDSFYTYQENATVYMIFPNKTILDKGVIEHYTYYWDGDTFVFGEKND